jgi:hypothetical protein
MNKIELLLPNSKIKKHKHKQFENYTIFNFTHDTYDAGEFSIPDGQSLTSPSFKSFRNKIMPKKFENVINEEMTMLNQSNVIHTYVYSSPNEHSFSIVSSRVGLGTDASIGIESLLLGHNN